MMVGTSAVAELIICTIDTQNQAISDATDGILEFWLWVLNLHKKLVLVMYNMSYSGVVSSVPFLVIIIVFAPTKTPDQTWWHPFQIPHLCEISHLLSYKLSHVKHVNRLLPNNLYYLNLLFISYPKALLMVMPPTIQCLLTMVISFSLNATKKWILMMYILNNVTKWPPNHIKNIMVEIILQIDA